jgi:hypothetical protein
MKSTITVTIVLHHNEGDNPVDELNSILSTLINVVEVIEPHVDHVEEDNE